MSDDAGRVDSEPQTPQYRDSVTADGSVAPVGEVQSMQMNADNREDDSEAGHEVVTRHPADRAGNLAYYAQLQTADEDLADNVASDVRARPSVNSSNTHDGDGDRGAEAAEYEEMFTVEGQSEERRGGTMEHHHSDAASATMSMTAVRQPTQGIQADADVDIKQATPADEDESTKETVIEHSNHAGTAAAAAASISTSTSLPTPNKTRTAPPRWSLLPQAPHGTAEVTVTILPMRAVTRVTVPVHSPSMYGPNSGGPATVARQPLRTAEGNDRNGAPYWVLIVKDLFEAIASRLYVHPESFRVFYQHKCLRFMGTLFLDCDITSSSTGLQAAEGGHDTRGSHDPSAATQPDEGELQCRAEPIWVSLVFPAPSTSPGLQGAGAKDYSFGMGSDGGDGNEELQASLQAVPPHLFGLGPEDFIARCIRLRPRKLEIPPRTLVEGRRQGYTYDQVIHRMQTIHDAQEVPVSQREGAMQHSGGLADSGSVTVSVPANFMILAVLQDGPTPPGKSFLGGYRDKARPHHVLLNAATQLYHRDLEYSPFASTAAGSRSNRCTRQTQTMGISRSCQTHREACVQTPRRDLLLDDSHDFVVVARPYFTAAELQVLRAEMAIIIQKMYRQWKARRIRAELEVKEAARQHRAGARQRREEALQMAVEDAAQLRRDDPRSASDFERVRQDILTWRADEAVRIRQDQSLSPDAARAALLALTETELQLLQQLDVRCREVGKTRREKQLVHRLQRMAAPKQWGTVYVSTPESERAAMLRDLYERLCYTTAASGTTESGLPVLPQQARGSHGASSSLMSGGLVTAGDARQSNFDYASGSVSASPQLTGVAGEGSPEAGIMLDNAPANLSSAMAARMDILLRVKWTVREFSAESSLSQEMCELIDREADLLHRGRKEASLTSLRKRIQTLFAQFIQDPQFNPVAKEFAQTARDRARVKAVETMQNASTKGRRADEMTAAGRASYTRK